MENKLHLTQLEQKIIRFLRCFIAEHGHGPTLVEIGNAVGISSKGTVHRYIQALVDKGVLLRTEERGWRGIRLAEHIPPIHATLPLVGRIAAGQPIEAIPQQQEINFSEFLSDDHFALEVKGDSMIDIGILNGDTVIIRRQSTAKNGDIVVALVDDEEATLKRFNRLPENRILLIPENSELAAMEYDAERVKIQGILIGQFRYYY